MEKKTKIIAMYLPQYHEISENDKWWGKGFTDWVSVKTSYPLYSGHRQPRVPLNKNYYDLSNVEVLRWQAQLAKDGNIFGFGIYHYWFSSELKLLTKPAELLLENKDIEIPFFFAWDNSSWIRSWSKYKHNTNAWAPKADQNVEEFDDGKGILAKLEYGEKKDWEIHFKYLLRFFNDSRYIKINNKPVFCLLNYNQKDVMEKMCNYWNELSIQEGYNGIYFICRLNPYDSMKGFDTLFTYEPMFSAWQNRNIFTRVINKMKDYRGCEKIKFYDYNKVWKRIIRHAERNKDNNVMYGGFVSYDDTPRRGNNGRVVKGESPELFEKYFTKLLQISKEHGKEYVFLTAWNEWGEGAYLEPDTRYGTAYLEAVKRAVDLVNKE